MLARSARTGPTRTPRLGTRTRHMRGQGARFRPVSHARPLAGSAHGPARRARPQLPAGFQAPERDLLELFAHMDLLVREFRSISCTLYKALA